MSAPSEQAQDDMPLPGEWVECWQCGGEGLVSSCLDDGACIDPEGGCELCLVNCDICEGAGGWNAPEPDNA